VWVMGTVRWLDDVVLGESECHAFSQLLQPPPRALCRAVNHVYGVNEARHIVLRIVERAQRRDAESVGAAEQDPKWLRRGSPLRRDAIPTTCRKCEGAQ
jgi:hypothetical protein